MANCLFCGDWTCCGGGASDGSGYTLPTASTTRKGGIKVGDGLQMNGDTLNVTLAGSDYSLRPATSYRLGGIMVGDGLSIDSDGVLSCSIAGGSITAEDTSETEFVNFVFGED